MKRIPAGALAEDDAERLAAEAAERAGWPAIAAYLRAEGYAAPAALLPTYRALREALMRGGPGARDRLARVIASLEDGPAPIETLFERVIFLFGIRRAGNHALASWLAAHFEDHEVVFLNSADLAAYRAAEGRYAVDFDKYRDLFRRPEQQTLIVGYENLDPSLFPLALNSRIARRAHALVLLRDLPNMAASIAKSARSAPAFAFRYRLRDFPDLWCRYARIHLDPPAPWRPVSYNRWVSEPDYRADLSRTLDLPRVEVPREAVSGIGGGSSFGACRFDGAASRMAVLSRWHAMQDDPLFHFLLLAEEEALPLNAHLFDVPLPGVEHWLERWRNG